ncbi:Glycine betaine/carnitine transport binding protein GbuC precursor [Pelotomaculum schinkii]|uniref:Glycine betaine/carnitine transport binding protein GbuC n=1 Tax=Pelotomaculum schinkii TaxID=78350 RepID=A0A4Y7RIM0_9FIRM|nr:MULTISPECIES: glycine betaine ABC transporter substrate-binding protein [Pelotomaculum]TEB08552.1 Glycine betaine/carnitine transport binding protein GbuC precursor [Pelotomaculum schinkii]TEB17035.1 Glycine betaine/carnitine transport binding protein GbuC precursor [Pelotomaculum sp. FP]
MKRALKLIVLLAVAVLLAGIVTGCGQKASQQDQGAKGQVELGYVQWDSEIASTNVVKKVLEDLGYEVKITAVDAAAMWLGVGEGNFDGIVAAWLPSTHKDYYANVKDKIEDLGPNLEGAKIGLVVPAYVTINSIEELNSVKDKFAGKITGIEPGAGIMIATETAIKDYDLNYELQSSSSAGMVAALKKAEDNKDWIVVTGWTPHWKFAKWDLKYLEDPKNIYGGEEYINTIVRKGLQKDKPEVYAVLDKFHWEASDMGAVMLDIENGMKPEEAAAKWVEANQDKVKEWTGK